MLNTLGSIASKRFKLVSSNLPIYLIALAFFLSAFFFFRLYIQAATTTVTFDNPAPPGASFDLIQGVFQQINFGTGAWRWENAYNVDPTKHVFFNSSTGTSRIFSFSPAPKILNSMRVFTSQAGTLTLSDNLGQTKTQSIATGSMQLVTTGWTQGSTTVTVSFTTGWNLGIDDIAFSDIVISNPPVLTINTPQNSATISGTTIFVTYVSSGDQTGVHHVHFQMDNMPEVMDVDFDGSYQFTNIPVGTHILKGYLVRSDHTKISGTDTSVSFTSVVDPADPTPPTVNLTQPLNNTTVSGGVTVTADASDAFGIAGVQFMLNGNNLGVPDKTDPYNFTWDTTTASNGTHTLSARALDISGNEALAENINVTVSNTSPTDPSQIGQWTTPTTMPLVAVNMVLLKTGEVLMLDGDTAGTSSYLWNPSTSIFTLKTNPNNQFCSAQTLLADGRTISVGGHTSAFVGIRNANFFSPITKTWSQGPLMASQRWYPTATTLQDGRVLVTSGSTTCPTCKADIPEIYNPTTNSWSSLTAARLQMPLYPFIFQLPDGQVLYAGSDEADTITRALDVATQTWTTIDPNIITGGSAAMYRPGKIIKAGTPGNVDLAPIPSENSTYVIDMNQPSPTWRAVDSMEFGRAYHTLTQLPDGNVIVTSGIPTTDETTRQGVFAAEIWNAQTETWSTMSSMQKVRSYHSSALLLPDGRVLVAGSGRLSPMINEMNYEIFSPPYLFKGARPIITSSPANITYGNTFTVNTPTGSDISSVALLRNGAMTHGIDMNQRYIPLAFSKISGGLTATAPINGATAPPGDYMLFIVNSAGIPSVAATLTISTDPLSTPTPIPQPVTLTKQVTASSDDVNQNGSTLSTSNTTIWLGNSSSTSSSYTGLRFNNITIPPGKTITSAHLEVYSTQNQTISLNMSIAAHAAGNSTTFTTNNKPSQHTQTTNKVNHSSNVTWNSNTWYSLNEINSVIQEIVNRSDWSSANSISLILKGTGTANTQKFVRSYNGSTSLAPKLIITYQ